MDDHHGKSALSELRPHPWSDERAFSYEAALVTVGKVIAWYSSRIFKEQEKPDPNPAVVERLLTEQAQCAQDQKTLSANDSTQIAAISKAYAIKLDILLREGEQS